MNRNLLFFIELAVSFLPFLLFAFLNGRANVKKEVRCRQYPMPIVAVVYSAVLLIFMSKVSSAVTETFMRLVDVFDRFGLAALGDILRNLYTGWGMYLALVLFNTAALLFYIFLKRFLLLFFGRAGVRADSWVGSAVSVFYTYDEETDRWYIREHYDQARAFIKTAYYACCGISGLALLISCGLCMKGLVSAPFYPVFAVIIIGEMAFFIDGEGWEERQLESDLKVQADRSRRVAMYPLLRKPLRALFGDKLSAEGTTVNNEIMGGGAIEDILVSLESGGGHLGKNYAAFIRGKMANGLRPNADYVRSGYDLAAGKSLLFNTPFYDKLNPYLFYAMNRELLTGGKVLIVLGRHGTEDDLRQWTERGMQSLSNVPEMWNISVLSGGTGNVDTLPDIGIITRSGVHDLDIQRNNLMFLREVSFVFVVEPSRLVTTAQIGLNLLIKCCGRDREVTFCSVDRNCDGLVDALSHILMTNITEVSATEYPRGMSSFMYWTADHDYLQHRILPGVSRYLGLGTELSLVALRNQVKKTVWYGGDVFPVQDARWIARQYYYDLMEYAKLPTNQESFDKYFKTSFNMCDERVSDYSFITVEDDRNNLFETRRNFATIAEEQGFVNVISTEYMLREYMAVNPELFMADAKAIPYIAADCARTKRNTILSLCLLLCIDSVRQEVLQRQLLMLNIETDDPVGVIWKEICAIFGSGPELDDQGDPILSVTGLDGRTANFEKRKTILFKRAYSVETGKFESIYTVDNEEFSRVILDDLQNARYIAEQENEDVYLGTELKGHVYQKYLPGQFFTLGGKYYEMVSATRDNRILVRRASEHIDGRLTYRQVRHYRISRLEDSPAMGEIKTVNDLDIRYQFADFSVETPGYWRMRAGNDFDQGDLVTVNGVPPRAYHRKQIVRLDFSKLGDLFTDSVRMTLANLMNEAFVTLFADNHPYISAVTPGSFDAPLTYSLALDEEIGNCEKSIFIIEDSQLDIGLLIAVERSINRILQIVADYLAWNDEQIAESIRKQNEPPAEKTQRFDVYAEESKPEKQGFFRRIGNWFRKLFGKKEPQQPEEPQQPSRRERKRAAKAEKKAAKAAEKEAKKAAKEAAAQAREAEKQKTGQQDPAADVPPQEDPGQSVNESETEPEAAAEEDTQEEEGNEVIQDE